MNAFQARTYLFAGRFKQAHAAAQQVLQRDPGDAEALLVMAAIALEHDNGVAVDRLVAALRQARHESCWLSVLEGRAALARQSQKTARERAMEALRLGTDDPHIANQLGVLLSRTGRHERAVEPFEVAVAGCPDNADYLYNLAVARQFRGDLRGAEADFRTLVEIRPDDAGAWLSLVQLARTPDGAWGGRLERLFDSSKDAETRLIFGHALAAFHEAREEWGAALDWLDRAKAGMAARDDHDRAGVEAMVAAALDAASRTKLDPPANGEHQPIFVVGMPRSGTTLVERIVTSHSQVVSLGELSDFAIVLKTALGTPGRLVLDSTLIEEATRHSPLVGVGEAYLARIAPMLEAAGHPGRFTDKMPFNAFLVPAILDALPGARVVFLRRSPFDVLFANYRQLFATSFGYYRYAYDFGDTAHFVAQFERMADHFERTLPRSRFHPIRYEDVVSDQRRETERLLEFCDLEWEDTCFDFHRNAGPVATASSVQVRSPIYGSSVGKWRRYGEGSTRAVAELAKYGISPDPG